MWPGIPNINIRDKKCITYHVGMQSNINISLSDIKCITYHVLTAIEVISR